MNFNKVIVKIKAYLLKILRQNTSPHKIALSFAIGTFIALIPLLGFGIIIGLIVAMIFKQLNKPALMSAFLIWNPFIVVPLMAISYQIGDIFFGQTEVIRYQLDILNNIFTYTRRFLVGHIVLSADLAIISYLIIRVASYFYHLRKKSKSKIKSAVEPNTKSTLL